MQRSTNSLRAVEREVRFAVPYFARVGVLVNDADDMPDLEGRPTGKVVLNLPVGELTSAHVGARIERFRTNQMQYLVVPADVYPWIDRHPELRRFLRSQFRRIEADEDACAIYVLDSAPDEEPLIGEDGLPIPPPEMVGLVAGWIQPDDFYRYGRYAATWIAEMLARNGVDPQSLGTVLDFGCGCGRVTRHWPSFTSAQLYGSDYNPHLVRWCSQNLPLGRFVVNDLEPPLPFDDDSFDLVHALSVFTHFDADLHLRWMEELVRVVRPGGLLLPTFHGRGRVEYMRLEGQYEQIAPGFDAGELVVTDSDQAGGSRCCAYQPERYIRDVLGHGLELLDFSPGGALDIQQDAVLFRKPG